MILFVPPNLVPAMPDITLAILGLLLLMLGVVGKGENYKSVARFGIASLVVSVILVCVLGQDPHSTFNGMFVTDAFSVFMKLLVLTGAAFSISMATGNAAETRIMRFEYPVLIIFSTLGMMLMISASDLMSLYVGLELQSLPLYVLAAMQRDSTRSTEAGLKYFILGALSSGLLLYGMSMVYGFTGSTSFELISAALRLSLTPGIIFGMVLMICGLAFKISAVPFHMWTPDVYEGAPSSVTAFFAIAPKIAALALLSRLLSGPFGGLVTEWRQVLVLMSVGSMALGAVAAIGQDNIKRLLAYSSIGHMGYALVGLAAGGYAGFESVLIYTAIYMTASIGAFSVVLMMRRGGRMVENVWDLAGLGRAQPLLALAMTIMMLSMAGIPPLAGFFGKLFVFQAAVNSGMYVLAVVGVLTSVIAAYYYLRIIKIMYFDEVVDAPLDKSSDPSLNFALALSSVALVLFIAVPAPLLTSAKIAALALLN